MTLIKYRQKRDFIKTPEPRGSSKNNNRYKNIFVIQKHAASHLHYDFRLELNGVLLSWAVPKGPCLDPNIKRLAMHVEDHPVEYAMFEGIIPQGEYGGGTVMLWDYGKWSCTDKNPNKAYRAGSLTFELRAKKLQGLWKLIQFKHNEKSWLLIKLKDKYAKSLDSFDITKEFPCSALTKQDLDDIANNYKYIWNKKGLAKKKQSASQQAEHALTQSTNASTLKINLTPSPMPKIISPMRGVLVDKPPQGKKWIHEIKFDGYRLVAFKQDKVVRLMTINNHDWTKKFPSIEKAIRNLNVNNIVLDGEVVVLDENQHSNFQLLQNVISQTENHTVIYFIFDLLYYQNNNLTQLPLRQRKKLLEKFLHAITNMHLKYSDHVSGSGKIVLNKSCKLGLEGIISKDLSSTYVQKRSRSWLKTKCLQRQEFVITGYTLPKHSRKYFGSLLLGVYDQRNQLVYTGHVGTGFTQASLKSIFEKLQKYITKEMPFNKHPPASKYVTWVKPVLIAEVEFSEWTNENVLRQPRFKGLRSDKSAQDIIKETALPVKKINLKRSSMNPLKITNPNKIFYPEDKITKLKIAEYYAHIGKLILPYIINRPLTILRCPEGYHECFYQKHVNKSTPPELKSIKIKEKDAIENYIYIEGHDGLFALSQMGVLEIHPWGSCIDCIEYPDMIIFDLDPADDVPWKEVVQTAFKLKNILANYKLTSFIKTTGGKGLHVILPIKPEYSWDNVKIFTKTIVNYLVLQHPNKYVGQAAKSKRHGKIFIDYMRNMRGATAIAPYSTRARKHAPVAMPLAWDELSNNYKDTYFTLQTAEDYLDKLKINPWKNFFKIKQSLRLKEILNKNHGNT